MPKTKGQKVPRRGRQRQFDVLHEQRKLESQYNQDPKNNQKDKKPKYLHDAKDKTVCNAVMSKRNRELAKIKFQMVCNENKKLKKDNARAIETIRDLNNQLEEKREEIRKIHAVLQNAMQQTQVLGMPCSCCSYTRPNINNNNFEGLLQDVIAQLNQKHHAPAPLYNNNNNHGNGLPLYDLTIQGTLAQMSSPLPPDLESIGRESLMMVDIETELYDYDIDNLDSQLDMYLDPVD